MGAPAGLQFLAAVLLLCLTSTASEARRTIAYSYLGCFNDNSTNRDLNGLAGIAQLTSRFSVEPGGSVYNRSAMSAGFCSGVCAIGEFPYFGLQNGNLCFCGSRYGTFGTSNDCNKTCTGDASQVCGGLAKTSLYQQSYAYESGSGCQLKFSQSPSKEILIPSTLYGPMTHQPDWAPPLLTRMLDCALQCKSSCLGFIYSPEPQRSCRLLRFAAVPSYLANATGDFFLRN